MIIIIEGIDRVGKTTLAQALCEKRNIPIFKKIREGGNEADGQYETMMNYGNALGLVEVWNQDWFTQDLIVDRFHWTEAVYGKCERHTLIPLQCMKNVENEMLFHKEKYLIVYVKPTDIEFSSRLHGKSLVAHELEFNQLYDRSHLNKIETNYDNLNNALKEIEKWLDQKS